MDTKAKIEVSETSLLQAKKYGQLKNYGRAFAHYLVYIELQPRQKKTIEKEFEQTLFEWTNHLEAQERFQDIFNCYEQALHYFSDNPTIHTNLGAVLLRSGHKKEARQYFQKAHNLDKYYLAALKYLDSVNNELVERWHFRMLNDKHRNISFKKAICRKISEGYSRILDIGTGSGILSMFAAENKKEIESVTTCECSPVMVEIATEVFKANNINNVKLIPKYSNDITEDLPEKVSLLITETVDVAIFGENILTTLIHALKNLVLPSPQGFVIPCKVDIYVCIIESYKISLKNTLKNDFIIEFLNKYNVNIACEKVEPYDTENIKCLKDVKYLCEPYLAWTVNFNNIEELEEILNGQITYCKLKFVQNGSADALVVWFTLHLDENTNISNNPLNTAIDSCWEQAVFNISPSFDASKDKECTIKMYCNNGILNANCENEQTVINVDLFKLSSRTLKFLNDSSIIDCLRKTALLINNTYLNKETVTILDLSPFPILGLLLMQSKNVNLYFASLSDHEESLVRLICEKSSTFSTVSLFNENSETLHANKFDVIYTDIFDKFGGISQKNILRIPFLKSIISSVNMFFPNKIKLYGQLVYSDWLNKVSKVDNENVCGYKISEFINNYRSFEHLDLQLENLEFTQLCKPYKLADIKVNDFKQLVTVVDIQCEFEGLTNAIIYWFDIDFLPEIYCTTKRRDSFVEGGAFLLQSETKINKRQCVQIKTIQQHGLFQIYLNN